MRVTVKAGKRVVKLDAQELRDLERSAALAVTLSTEPGELGELGTALVERLNAVATLLNKEPQT